MIKSFDLFKNNILNSQKNGYEERLKQTDICFNILKEHFKFDYINFLETGCTSDSYDNFGLLFAMMVDEIGGTYHTVDINENYIKKSKDFFDKIIPNNSFVYETSDSIEYLNNFNNPLNLVHLDSYDLDIKEPIPSSLHHLYEFLSIKDKMPQGSIVIVDDNYLNGTRIWWHNIHNGEYINTEEIDIQTEIIGKGSLIYHSVKQGKIKDWILIGNHYGPAINHKLYFKKI